MRRFEGWRLRTEHETHFSYEAPARASYNEVRQIPKTIPSQTALDVKVQTTPAAPQYAYWDYWGTQVIAFNVDRPHHELVISSSALVETQPARDPIGASWHDVHMASERFAELLAPSRYTSSNSEVEEIARSLRTSSPVSTIEAVVGWVHESLEYVQGATNVHTSAMEAFSAGRGVCQDFAHLAIVVLRTAGIPARYVSGYLHPNPDAEVGDEAKGESHAWVEAWAGDWWGKDPTNAVDIGLRHVVVARARDYADVAPVRGVYAGSSPHQSKVTVRITRMV